MSGIHQDASASPPGWEASAELYSAIDGALAETPGGADIDVGAALRAKWPRVPYEVIAAATREAAAMLDARGWSVDHDDEVLVVRRRKRSSANETYVRTVSRLISADALALGILLAWVYLSQIVAFVSGFFSSAPASGDASCPARGAVAQNVTAFTCGITGSIVTMLPLTMGISVLGLVLSAAFRMMERRRSE